MAYRRTVESLCLSPSESRLPLFVLETLKPLLSKEYTELHTWAQRVAKAERDQLSQREQEADQLVGGMACTLIPSAFACPGPLASDAFSPVS